VEAAESFRSEAIDILQDVQVRKQSSLAKSSAAAFGMTLIGQTA